MITIKLTQSEIEFILQQHLKVGFLESHELKDTKVVAGRNGNGVSIELSFCSSSEEFVSEDKTEESEVDIAAEQPVKRKRRTKEEIEAENNPDLEFTNNYKPTGLFKNESKLENVKANTETTIISTVLDLEELLTKDFDKDISKHETQMDDLTFDLS